MAKKMQYDITLGKVQKAVLSDTIKRCNKNNASVSSWIWGETDDPNTVWIGDGHFVAAIPRQYCFLSLRETFEELGRPNPIDIKRIVHNGTKAELLEDPSIKKAYRLRQTRTLTNGKVVEAFALENSEEKVYVDVTFLNYFGDNLEFCEFYGGNSKSPLWIVNAGLVVNGIVGLICPVCVNE